MTPVALFAFLAALAVSFEPRAAAVFSGLSVWSVWQGV